MDENRLLANEHGIPWHLSRDIAHFRAYTQNKWLLLGRRTFEEMRGWFNDSHMPLVLTSQCGYDPAIGRAVASVPQAIALAEAAGQNEIVVCGGGQVYTAAIPYADRMVITQVNHRFECEERCVYFPEWDTAQWHETERERFPADAENIFDMSIVTLMRNG